MNLSNSFSEETELLSHHEVQCRLHCRIQSELFKCNFFAASLPRYYSRGSIGNFSLIFSIKTFHVLLHPISGTEDVHFFTIFFIFVFFL